MDILEHLGMLVPDIEGHGVITGRANGPWQSRYSSSQQAGSLLSLVLIAFVQVAGYGPNISFEINRYDQPPARSLNETF